MKEVEIKFEREKRDGIVPVGTYLIDAAKRFGLRFEESCDAAADVHFCSADISSGSDLLSPLTDHETKHFETHERRTNERLMCQVKIEKPGEIIIMTEEKKKTESEEATPEEKSEQFKKEFADMPLEKKIASLVQLEAIALGETFSFIVNSPYKIAEKVMDVMAEFGFKKEEEQRNAARPDEHKKGSSSKKGSAASKSRAKAETTVESE